MLLSSGFEAQRRVRRSAQPLEVPQILKVEHGRSGELVVFPSPLGRDASSYDAECKLQDEPDTPEAWQTTKLASARGGVRFGNLEPGKVYVFRVRAQGKLGKTDWSQLVAKMCT